MGISGSQLNCFGLFKCFDKWLLSSSEPISSDKKIITLEQKINHLEQKCISSDESDLRLHNKYSSLEAKYETIDKSVQQHTLDIKTLLIRLQKLEHNVSNMEFQHSEILDNDIIVITEV